MIKLKQIIHWLVSWWQREFAVLFPGSANSEGRGLLDQYLADLLGIPLTKEVHLLINGNPQLIANARKSISRKNFPRSDL